MIKKCLRCGKEWKARTLNPKTCAVCHSPFWNKPYLKKEYECTKCGHTWAKRRHSNTKPAKLCPNCATPYWEDYNAYLNSLHECKCLRCNHKWNSRSERSTKCPNCNSYFWDDLLEHNIKGKNNPRWSGGKSHFKDHYTLKKNRKIVLEKAKYKCAICKKEAKFTYHMNGDKNDHKISNLTPVCAKCLREKFHKGKFGRPSKFELPVKEIANAVGCCENVVYAHISKRRLSKNYGDAINTEIERRN